MRYLLATLFVLIFTTVAGSASIKKKTVLNQQGDTDYMVEIKGLIEPGDSIKFLNVVSQTEGVTTVWLESNGGMVNEGMAIAKMIKVMGLSTYVHESSYCNSICSIIFLSGKRKLVNANSHIGVHAAFVKDSKVRDLEANATIAWYLGSLGYPEELADLWVKTKPNALINLNVPARKNLELGFEAVEPIKIPLLNQVLPLD